MKSFAKRAVPTTIFALTGLLLTHAPFAFAVKCDPAQSVNQVLRAVGSNEPWTKAQVLDRFQNQSADSVLKNIFTMEKTDASAAALKKFYPKTALFRKLVDRQALTDTELKQVIEAVLKDKDLPKFTTHESFFDYFRTNVLGPYLKTELARPSIEGLARASAVLEHPALGYEAATQIISEIGGHPSGEQKTYHDILEVFDVVGITGMIKGTPASEPITLDIMKKSAAQYLATEKQLSALKNANFKDVTVAMKDILGQKAIFRDDGVVMGPNGKTRSYYIQTSREAAQNLSDNGLLTVTVLKSGKNPDAARVYVEYPAAQNYQKFAHLLSPSLRKDLGALRSNAAEARVAALNQRITKELTDSLLDPKKVHNIVGTMEGIKPEDLPAFQKTKLKPTDLYRTLVSIHPLGDGNGRLSRLFFEYVAREPKWHGRLFKMDSPAFDMDLFGNESQLESFLALEPGFTQWIASAKSDSEFLKRCEESLDLLVTIHPELKATFPELVTEGVGKGDVPGNSK